MRDSIRICTSCRRRSPPDANGVLSPATVLGNRIGSGIDAAGKNRSGPLPPENLAVALASRDLRTRQDSSRRTAGARLWERRRTFCTVLQRSSMHGRLQSIFCRGLKRHRDHGCSSCYSAAMKRVFRAVVRSTGSTAGGTVRRVRRLTFAQEALTATADSADHMYRRARFRALPTPRDV